MYTKLAQSILTSTIWGEDDKTLRVWITLLAMADKNGEVISTIPGLSRISCVPLEDVEKALLKFMSPDKYSRTPDDEGRRIEKTDDGWFIINHEKYRKLASKEDQKAKNAERVRRWRERQKRKAAETESNETLTSSNEKHYRSNGKTVTDNDTLTQGRDIAKAYTDTDTKTESLSLTREEQERENRLDQELAQNAVANGSSVAEAPTIEEVMLEAEMRGIPREHATSFFEYNEGQQLWQNRNGKPINWKMSLKSWSERRRTMNTGPANGRTGYKKIEI